MLRLFLCSFRRTNLKQECIPVGFVPPTLYRTGGSLSREGLYLRGLCLGGFVIGLCPKGLCREGYLSKGGFSLSRGDSVREKPHGRNMGPETECLMYTCGNITLLQTSSAGSNYQFPKACMTFMILSKSM